MKAEKTEEFEFKLHGNGVSPTTFKAKEVAQVLANIEEALKEYILSNNKDLKDDDLFISLIQVEDKSLTLKFHPNIKQYFLSAIIAISGAINTRNAATLPPNSIDALREVQKVIRAKGCIGDFRQNGESLASITADTEISIPQSEIIKGDTILYAEVVRVGGVEPRVRIKLDDGRSISFDVKQTIAQQLAKRLYNEVGFRGNAQWLKNNHSLIDFKIESLIDTYEPTTNKEAFSEISNIIGKYWDNVDETEYLNG